MGILQEVTSQLWLALGVLATFIAGPALALIFMVVNRRRAMAARRSPIGINLLRSPGHTLRDQMEEENENVSWDLMVLSALPLVVLSLFLAQAHARGGMAQMQHLVPVYVVMVALPVAHSIYKLVKRGKRLHNLRAGYDAELAVGQELDTLARRGAIVYHDFPADGFNIDHVVITPAAVYAVETKGYTKLNTLKGREGATVEYDGMTLKFPRWTTDEPILQAERNAKWLADWIKKSTGHATPVRAVVALPGWFVKEKGVGAVKVYSGRQLGLLLEAQAPRLDPRTQNINHQVEQRCRTVVPTYKRIGVEKT